MDYSEYASSYAQSSGGGAGSTIFSLILGAALVLGDWILFEKAGEPGWKSIVPGLNIWTMFDLAYGAGWKCLLLLVPLFNIVVWCAFCIRFCKAFGCHFIFGIAMWFLPSFVLLFLAFSKVRYEGPTYSFL